MTAITTPRLRSPLPSASNGSIDRVPAGARIPSGTAQRQLRTGVSRRSNLMLNPVLGRPEGLLVSDGGITSQYPRRHLGVGPLPHVVKIRHLDSLGVFRLGERTGDDHPVGRRVYV